MTSRTDEPLTPAIRPDVPGRDHDRATASGRRIDRLAIRRPRRLGAARRALRCARTDHVPHGRDRADGLRIQRALVFLTASLPCTIIVGEFVDLRIAPGEIVGVTGLGDSGYHEVPCVLAGAERTASGQPTVAGADVDLRRLDPVAAQAAGIALIPGGREHAGLGMELTVADNAAVPRTGTWRSRLRPIPRRQELTELDPWLDRLQLRPRDPRIVVRTLSGGNQQRVVLAKWLARDPKVLAIHEPTQAIDVGAREIIVQAVKDAPAAGCGVLVASGDENELSMLCDRVVVFRDGRIDHELTGPSRPDDIVAAIVAATDRRPFRPTAA